MSRRMTASELMAELASDPQYVAQQNIRSEAARKLIDELRVQQQQILCDLEACGVKVDSVWDFVNDVKTYKPAIPVLVSALHGSYSRKLREGLVRSLTTKEARGLAGEPLLSLLKSLPGDDREMRWLVANALTLAATPDMRKALQAVAADEKDPLVRKRLVHAHAGLKT